MSKLSAARHEFHSQLCGMGLLGVGPDGTPTNADGDNASSIAISRTMARALRAPAVERRLAAQTVGSRFEKLCAAFLASALEPLDSLVPGGFVVERITSGELSQLSRFAQYTHLKHLANQVQSTAMLRTVLGNAYEIAPDVLVHRRRVASLRDGALRGYLDPSVGTLASTLDAPRRSLDLSWTEEAAGSAEVRAAFNEHDSRLLHAVVSCKWTLRTDRAQNARSEALNLLRNRKGRAPHIVVVTAEPLPTRIASLALGTGDIDCTYHVALDELRDGVDASAEKEKVAYEAMVQGRRLKDISDLPLDLLA